MLKPAFERSCVDRAGFWELHAAALNSDKRIYLTADVQGFLSDTGQARTTHWSVNRCLSFWIC